MKKIVSASIVFVLISHAATAQNVGIGTSTPAAKLEIIDTAVNHNHHTLLIKSKNSHHSVVIEKTFTNITDYKPAMVVIGKSANGGTQYTGGGLFVAGNADSSALNAYGIEYGYGIAGVGKKGVIGYGETGVYGRGNASNTNDWAAGVIGFSDRKTAYSQYNLGVWGEYTGNNQNNAYGVGVVGRGPGYEPFPQSKHIGIYGSALDYGVYGYSNATGIMGYGVGIGVKGESSSFGVVGTATGTLSGTGVRGEGIFGVRGIGQTSTSGIGILGSGYTGLRGESTTLNGTGIIGLYSANAPGSFGGMYGAGVYGRGFYGVSGYASMPGIVNSGTSVAIRGEANGANSIAVWGIAPTPSAGFHWAGYFTGNVNTIGNTYVTGSKNFRIDHPLDPENKYLVHSCVESDEMANMYNGSVTTDANGYATVQLPDWFEAENENFKYQLTCIGQFAQAIVKEEIKNNQFIIQTDKPAVKISWQVVGNRKDVYAKKSGFKVEVEKTAQEKGKYLNATYYGLPEEKTINNIPKPTAHK